VKLVAEVGVGTVAAGVAKAHADVILISGYDGGTGASPISSIRHAGVPWELGLSETQQVWSMNDLRSRVRLQVDGKLQTGRDVAVAALLGAEEFGFATTAASSPWMHHDAEMPTEHLPGGRGDAGPGTSQEIQGQPEHVINFLFYVAEDLRRVMAGLGFRKLDEMIGRVDCLIQRRTSNTGRPRDRLVLCALQPADAEPRGTPLHAAQDHGLDDALDGKLIEQASEAIENLTPVSLSLPIRNVHRTVGAMLSGEIARRHGSAGLPDDTIRSSSTDCAGQSFGAFLAKGVTLTLEGEANDYVGKGSPAAL